MRFAEIPVRNSIVQLLSRLADSGKIPHAILVKGLEGSANLAASIAFAQYMLCDNPINQDSCGECPNCKKVQSLTHPDLFFSFPFIADKHKKISPDFMEEWRALLTSNPFPSIRDWQEIVKADTKQMNIYIAEIRDITKRLSMKSYSGKKKILIMWLPEFMGKEGNVMLKLIEEPPADTIFLLVTEDESKILTTIISRTQRINIPSPGTEEVMRYLLKINADLSEEQARTIATICNRNINKALNILDNITEPYFELFRNWLILCYQKKYSEISSTIEQLSKENRESCINFLNYGMEMIRKAFAQGHQSVKTELPATEQNFVVKFAELMVGKSFEELYKIFNDAIYGIERNGNVKLLMMDTSIKLKNILTKK